MAIYVHNDRLKSIVQFSDSGFASRVAHMVRTKFLHATNVGFRPLAFKFSGDPARPHGIDFLEQELLEFSLVAVPANSEALLDTGKSADSTAARRRRREVEVYRLRLGP
jgi:hypothetical protein